MVDPLKRAKDRSLQLRIAARQDAHQFARDESNPVGVAEARQQQAKAAGDLKAARHWALVAEFLRRMKA
jgi:hypothetical protein